MKQPNEKGTQKDLVLYRIETAQSDIKAAEILLGAKEFRGANNRAYYGIYHAVSAIHALDGNACIDAISVSWFEQKRTFYLSPFNIFIFG